MSLAADIMTAIANRLRTVTTANGYGTNVVKVYNDNIPMGLRLNSYEMPAIFLLDSDSSYRTEHKVLIAEWTFNLQLWNNRVTDKQMMEFRKDVAKAIFANSSSAQREDEFRSLHPNIVEVKLLRSREDLNMIESNRVSELTFVVHYRTRLFNM